MQGNKVAAFSGIIKSKKKMLEIKKSQMEERNMLYDLEFQRWISSSKAKKNEYVQAILKKAPKHTVIRAINYIDNALLSIKPSFRSSLVWTRMSSLVGNKTPFLSVYDHDHFWNMLINPICATKDGNKFAGAFFLWRVACIAEETNTDWVTNKKETDTWDDYSQQYIYFRQYWINDGNMKLPPKKLKKATFEDLLIKFKGLKKT